MTRLIRCAECGEPTNSITLICERCAPLYEDASMGDECGCVDCSASSGVIASSVIDRLAWLHANSGAQL